MYIKIVRLAAIATFAFQVIPAQATTVLIDDFLIMKNGSVMFQDTFDNGLPPPDSGGNTQTYKVFGGPLGPESGGKLALNDNGQVVSRPDVGAMQRQGARVKTNTDPLQPTRGLRTDDLFSVTGLFDLTLVPNVRERYGVRLTDGGSTNSPFPNDGLGISVMRTSLSQIDIMFHHYDQTAFTFIDLEAIALEAGHDQIEMTLSRLDLGNSEITASFRYVDGGIFGATTTFLTTEAIFNGEDFTRAAFIYLAPVPLPAALPLFIAGLAMFGFVWRRKPV